MKISLSDCLLTPLVLLALVISRLATPVAGNSSQFRLRSGNRSVSFEDYAKNGLKYIADSNYSSWPPQKPMSILTDLIWDNSTSDKPYRIDWFWLSTLANATSTVGLQLDWRAWYDDPSWRGPLPISRAAGWPPGSPWDWDQTNITLDHAIAILKNVGRGRRWGLIALDRYYYFPEPAEPVYRFYSINYTFENVGAFSGRIYTNLTPNTRPLPKRIPQVPQGSFWGQE